jgi:hypothetical protein
MSLTIETLQKQLDKAGKLFIYNPEEEQDDEKQMAYIYFIGTFDGKPVIYDSYITTLANEYQLLVMEEAEDEFFARYPELVDVDYDELSEDLKDELDMLMDQVHDQKMVEVCESLDYYEDEEETSIGLEVGLNVPEITDEVMTAFIQKFNAGNFEPDETSHRFDLD